jgi:hypothetical protein
LSKHAAELKPALPDAGLALGLVGVINPVNRPLSVFGEEETPIRSVDQIYWTAPMGTVFPEPADGKILYRT